MTNVHNTLYVTTPEAYVGLEGDSLRVRVERQTRMQVPLHHLVSVVCVGPALVSADAMAACAESGVAVVFLRSNGRFLARVEPRGNNTATLRRAQYRAADDPARTLSIARSFVVAKIANTRVLLRRGGRTRDEGVDEISAAADRLRSLAERAATDEDLDTLRGHEGEAAARYFEVFDALMASEHFRFERRTRRPPENAVNAMLSFGYAMLSVDCTAALQGAGLDPAVGYLHGERSGRPALALDLMEEFRALIVDRLVLALVRLKQVAPDDFERLPTGEVRLSDAIRKTFLIEYQRRKQEEVSHPSTGQTGAWAIMPHIQARLLARAIREGAEYVPFFGR
ncbi:MAG: type I-C CRISPR-associated endonuclease Cas1c [Polyangiales bacterium]